MKKLIVFDIDGTLRDEVLGIPGSIPFVLKQLKKRGHETTICTGRSRGTVQDDVLKLGIENLITGGGSYITHKDTTVFEAGLDADAVRNVWLYLTGQLKEKAACRITESKGGGMIKTSCTGAVLEGRDEMYMNQTAADILNNMNREKSKTHTSRQRAQFLQSEKIIYRNNIEEFRPKEEKIHKICLWSSPREYGQIMEIVGADRTELAQQGRWEEYNYYEIIGRGAGKGAAVSRLCTYLGIGTEDTIAFGDGRNDIEMLKCCGTGIAMANGAKELFPFADSICGKPMDNGIYIELSRRGLIDTKAKGQDRG